MGGLAIILGIAFIAAAFTENRKGGRRRILAALFLVIGTVITAIGMLGFIESIGLHMGR